MLALASLVGALFMTAALPPTGSAAPQGPWQLPASELSDSGQDAQSADVAIAPDGTTTAVWQRLDGLKYIAQASTRPPGGTFGPPEDLSATGQSAISPKIAAAPDGTATVVWSRSDGANQIVQAVTRPPGGSFGTPEDLSVPGGDAVLAQVSVAADGTTGVAWKRDFGSNQIVQAAIRPPGGAFENPVSLSGGGSEDAQGPQISLAPDGTATVVWHKSNGSNAVVSATTRPPGGSFGTPVNLSAPGQNAGNAQIASGPDGSTTAVWNRFDGSDYIIQGRTRPPGGLFGPVVDISGTGEDSLWPEVAIGPDGTAAAVWARLPRWGRHRSGLDPSVRRPVRYADRPVLRWRRSSRSAGRLLA